jgi:hypothetical protein
MKYNIKFLVYDSDSVAGLPKETAASDEICQILLLNFQQRFHLCHEDSTVTKINKILLG